MDLQQGMMLALKTLCKTLDATHPKAEEFEFAAIGKDGDHVKIHNLAEAEIQSLIDKSGIIKDKPAA